MLGPQYTATWVKCALACGQRIFRFSNEEKKKYCYSNKETRTLWKELKCSEQTICRCGSISYLWLFKYFHLLRLFPPVGGWRAGGSRWALTMALCRHQTYLSLLLMFWRVNNSAVEASRLQVNVWSAIKWFSLTLALCTLQASHLNSSMQNTCVHLKGISFRIEFVFQWKGQWWSVMIFNQQTTPYWVLHSAVNPKVGGSSQPGNADLIFRVPLTSATLPGHSQWHGDDYDITMELIRKHILKVSIRWVAVCHPRLYVSARRWAVTIPVGWGSVNQRIVVEPTFPSCWSKLRSFNTLWSLSCSLVFGAHC